MCMVWIVKRQPVVVTKLFMFKAINGAGEFESLQLPEVLTQFAGVTAFHQVLASFPMPCKVKLL